LLSLSWPAALRHVAERHRFGNYLKGTHAAKLCIHAVPVTTRSMNLNLIGGGRGELSGEFVKPAGDDQERFLPAKSSELGARCFEGE
jgi:hypothetical protein